jgi:hypothetical protein
MDTIDWRAILLPKHRLLQELVAFHDEIAARTGCDDALDDIGLLLDDEPYRYDMTPRNAAPFVTTGGNGCHYSLLMLEDRPPEHYPIVLTVPMALHEDKSRYNHIVGEDLGEFLNLGCYFGYFALEGLAFDNLHGETILDLGNAHPLGDEWPERLELLAELRQRFDLKPWPDVAGRLRQLKKQYYDLLDVDWTWLEA